MLDDKVILITGGTGSFGHKFTERIFKRFNPRKLIIYSRDEYKQYLMQKRYEPWLKRMRFQIGDVRDQDRLYRAFEGVDVVIHAAALKHVPAMEYNPIEAVKTNIHGAENVINAALDRGVKKVIALSTDKGVYPVNLYGATKMVSDKLFVHANAYRGLKDIAFSVVRYGNVAGSRGSVIPYFKSLLEKGEKKLPITDPGMTRFWISLDEGVDLVFEAIEKAKGTEVYVAKIPSFKVVDLARAMASDVELKDVGMRAGEKLHEIMITEEDSRKAYDFGDYYIIYPQVDWWDINRHFNEGGKPVPSGFKYSSDANDRWLTVEQMRELVTRIDIVY
ncbi:MAG: UDP-N-acetylglucosamine 4,6-dehydratase (inverting) [Candidatus Aminicenantes bacterium]|nr:UDP-N-acetylglucosamine 4,6-dehydratase (inverting) [Candidatus Aminicenantes bacterium]